MLWYPKMLVLLLLLSSGTVADGLFVGNDPIATQQTSGGDGDDGGEDPPGSVDGDGN